MTAMERTIRSFERTGHDIHREEFLSDSTEISELRFDRDPFDFESPDPDEVFAMNSSAEEL